MNLIAQYYRQTIARRGRRRQRELEIRRRRWDGRISDDALDRLVQHYNLRFYAYLWGGLWVLVIIILAAAGLSTASYAAIAPDVLGCCFILHISYKRKREGVREIVRQYELPKNAFRGKYLQTPEQFDRVLEHYGRSHPGGARST